MKRAASHQFLLLLILCALLMPLAVRGSKEADPPAAARKVIERITIADEVFKLEVAADTASRAKGLMERDKIEADGGMLFIYPAPEILSYWMYNCLVDIDLLYLDERGRIICVHKMKAEPQRGENEPEWKYEARLKRYSSRKPAQFVIELKEGSIDRLKLKVGQMIEMDLPRLKRIAE